MDRSFIWFLCFSSLLWSCAPSSENNPDADIALDADADSDSDSEDDGGPSGCQTAADCDDGFPCTQDVCAVGGTCRHIPLDDLCPGDQVCREGRGCVDPSQCETSEDCDDGVFCNGQERCIGGSCYDGVPRDCNDGNECTEDYCNIATDRCVHAPIPGCDPDGGIDGGPVPFDPAAHYDGAFRLFPVRASECVAATFSISRVTFSSTSELLTLQAGAFTMTQAPRPGDETFDVTYTQTNCGNYRLTGTFNDSDSFEGSWTASFFGACNICVSQDDVVAGVRE